MGLSLKFLVLFAFAFNLVLCDFDCPSNKFRNNQGLISRLSGWLYTLYTTQVFGNNEIFNCDVSLRDGNVYCLTTNDNQCCRLFNVTTSPVARSRNPTTEYFKYHIKTAPDCPQQLDESAHMKLISGRIGFDGSYCLILWTCRPSRQGFHAFCTKQTVSQDQHKWIAQQYSRHGQTPIAVEQVQDYRTGKCFPSATSVQTGWDNIFRKKA